mmetsp:Transcript_41236/g.128153  ORF Transcript_41236/g.128153 Transcript_41236/m.128153 type:complete len:254 (-) Transcript_41236:689-1450(-)
MCSGAPHAVLAAHHHAPLVRAHIVLCCARLGNHLHFPRCLFSAGLYALHHLVSCCLGRLEHDSLEPSARGYGACTFRCRVHCELFWRRYWHAAVCHCCNSRTCRECHCNRCLHRLGCRGSDSLHAGFAGEASSWQYFATNILRRRCGDRLGLGSLGWSASAEGFSATWVWAGARGHPIGGVLCSGGGCAGVQGPCPTGATSAGYQSSRGHACCSTGRQRQRRQRRVFPPRLFGRREPPPPVLDRHPRARRRGG